MAIAKNDLGRIQTHDPSLSRVHTDIQTMETNIASLLSGGTTSTSQIHHVNAASTANVASLASASVSVDGLTLVAGNRLLLKDQSSADENGIYVVGTVALGAAPLTRATDWDASVEVKGNSIVAVLAGTANRNTYWQLYTNAAVVVDTDNQVFVQIHTDTELGSTASGKGASIIGLQDASGLVTGTDLEAAVATDIAKGNGLLAMAPVRRVRAVTTGNLASFAGISETFDGLTLVEGNRVLVAAQSTPAENGIYVVGAVAGGVADWSRAADMAASAVVPNGTIIVVDAGTLGANQIYKLTNAGTITIATTGLTFERIYNSTELASPLTGLGASLVGVEDAEGLLLASSVEGVLSGDVATGNGMIALAPVRRVRAVTVANLASFSGVSETLDGLTLVEGNRVLVSAQSTPAENGIYEVGAVAGGVADWSRAADMDTPAIIPNGTIIVVDAGTVGANRVYKLTNAGDITIGTTGLTFERLYTSTEFPSLPGVVQKRTATIGHADLTNAVNGASDTINVGAVLPANAVVVASEVNIATLFSGGGATAVKIDLGGTDIDAIGAQHDVFTGAATGALDLNPAGVHVSGLFSSEQLVATFTPDGAHTLQGLDAGALTITVWFITLA